MIQERNFGDKVNWNKTDMNRWLIMERRWKRHVDSKLHQRSTLCHGSTRTRSPMAVHSWRPYILISLTVIGSITDIMAKLLSIYIINNIVILGPCICKCVNSRSKVRRGYRTSLEAPWTWDVLQLVLSSKVPWSTTQKQNGHLYPMSFGRKYKSLLNAMPDWTQPDRIWSETALDLNKSLPVQPTISNSNVFIAALHQAYLKLYT